MPTKLDRLLQSIDPRRTLDEVSARVDRAVNTFATRGGTIEDWDEYENLLADFYGHILKTVLRMGSGAPHNREIFWGQCSNLLNQAFGPNGYKAAFEMVRTGTEGGLYRVLKTVADLMAEHYAQNEISARISHYWNNLSVNEQLAATDEYLRKYGNLLPRELTEGSAARIKANFPKVLQEHPSTLRRLRRIGR
jgi:hypothetical protein